MGYYELQGVPKETNHTPCMNPKARKTRMLYPKEAHPSKFKGETGQ